MSHKLFVAGTRHKQDLKGIRLYRHVLMHGLARYEQSHRRPQSHIFVVTVFYGFRFCFEFKRWCPEEDSNLHEEKLH